METKDKLKCKVVMLSTEKASKLYKHTKHGLYLLADLPHGENTYNGTNQHLYFVSEREIKADDWFLNDLKEILKTKKEATLKAINSVDIGEKSWFKIEATTDPSLGLRLIPQSFVEKYVEKQGKIEDVLVDMEYAPGFRIEADPTVHGERVKVRKDNTVICSPVKESWTKDEVFYIARRCAMEAFTSPETFACGVIFDKGKFHEWYKSMNF